MRWWWDAACSTENAELLKTWSHSNEQKSKSILFTGRVLECSNDDLMILQGVLQVLGSNIWVFSACNNEILFCLGIICAPTTCITVAQMCLEALWKESCDYVLTHAFI